MHEQINKITENKFSVYPNKKEKKIIVYWVS